MAVKYIPDELVAEIRNRKHDVQVFIKEAVEEKLKGEKLTAEEVDYILSFMQDSSTFCKTDDDYKFDGELKKKLVRLIK